VIVGITVNGVAHRIEVAGPESLLRVLRDDLGLMGSKNACEQGECGSCTVILDGVAVCSCLVMAAAADGREVVTIEGIVGPGGGLHPVQEAMLEAGAVQCGFCTPGIVVTASGLFDGKQAPAAEDIKEGLSGNLCRCTGYGSILRALGRLGGES
jgi:carbon-monoxide dehydrogenase small subunit